MTDERKAQTASKESGRRGPEPADGLDRQEGRIVYVSSDDIVADAKQIIDSPSGWPTRPSTSRSCRGTGFLAGASPKRS